MGLLWLKGYSLSRATGYLRDCIYLFSNDNMTSTHIDRGLSGICLGQIIHLEGTQLEKQRVRLKVETSTCSQLF